MLTQISENKAHTANSPNILYTAYSIIIVNIAISVNIASTAGSAIIVCTEIDALIASTAGCAIAVRRGNILIIAFIIVIIHT